MQASKESFGSRLAGCGDYTHHWPCSYWQSLMAISFVWISKWVIYLQSNIHSEYVQPSWINMSTCSWWHHRSDGTNFKQLCRIIPGKKALKWWEPITKATGLLGPLQQIPHETAPDSDDVDEMGASLRLQFQFCQWSPPIVIFFSCSGHSSSSPYYLFPPRLNKTISLTQWAAVAINIFLAGVVKGHHDNLSTYNIIPEQTETGMSRLTRTLWPGYATWRHQSGSTSINDLFLCGTKPLPEPMLTYHQMCPVVLTQEQFCEKAHERNP